MSSVYILDHNEIIFTILDKPPPPTPRTPRYESELEKQLKKMKIPQLRRTFGYAETPCRKPDNFLKKGQGLFPPIKTTDHKCIEGHMAPVPRRPPPGKGPERPVKNFRVVNIKKAIRSKAKPPQPRLVDTRDGHIKKIKGSGEVPEYCLLPLFGKMPPYLIKRNRKIKEKLDKIQEIEDNRESLCRLVAEEERQKLLTDLKYNWALMQKAYLQQPMLIDTIPKILKQSKLERELRQLEKDIALVESNPYIYIYKS